MSKLYGGVDLGGTTLKCIIAAGPDDVRCEASVPTTTPAESLKAVADFFRDSGCELAGLGIGSFGHMLV